MEAPQGDEYAVRTATAPVVVVGCRIDGPPVEAFLRSLPGPRIAWGDGDDVVAAGGATETIQASGAGRFETIRTAADALLGDLSAPAGIPAAARPRLFGGFAFHDDHAAVGRSGPWEGFPGALFVLPKVQLTETDDGTWLTATATGPDAPDTARARLDTWRDRIGALPAWSPTDPPGVVSRRPTPDRSGWNDQVRAAVDRVRRGDLRKVVLAQSLGVELGRRLDVSDALARLRGTYPDCYRFVFEPPDGGTFFGATPERLVELDGRTVRTTALAGSTGRGDTADEDEWLADRLRESGKDVHEHELVVEAIREQLEPLAATVSTGERTVRKLATVQHLQTPIGAELSADTHVLSLVEALHPTPAVGGLPPDAALETIREAESFDRGWYASPIGWFDADGNGTFAVALRSAVARERRATLFAGDGLVADSDPAAEWDELRLKYAPVLDELE